MNLALPNSFSFGKMQESGIYMRKSKFLRGIMPME